MLLQRMSLPAVCELCDIDAEYSPSEVCHSTLDVHLCAVGTRVAIIDESRREQKWDSG